MLKLRIIILQVNMKYSDKQRFRRYKTKTEPKLFSKITIDEEDDIVKTIKKAFGIEDKKKLNYSEVETSGTPYYETPIQQAPEIVNQEQPRMRERPQMIEGPIRQQPQMRERPIRQPSASTEITSEIAQPPQMSPGKLTELMLSKQSEENTRIRESAIAINKAEDEKARLLELSRIAKEEQEKEKAKEEQEKAEEKIKPGDTVAKIREVMRQRDKREQDILAKDPKSRTREEREILQSIKETKKAEALMKKQYEKRLTEFVG